MIMSLLLQDNTVVHNQNSSSCFFLQPILREVANRLAKRNEVPGMHGEKALRVEDRLHAWAWFVFFVRFLLDILWKYMPINTDSPGVFWRQN